jgi:hypothetical protein
MIGKKYSGRATSSAVTDTKIGQQATTMRPHVQSITRYVGGLSKSDGQKKRK